MRAFRKNTNLKPAELLAMAGQWRREAQEYRSQGNPEAAEAREEAAQMAEDEAATKLRPK